MIPQSAVIDDLGKPFPLASIGTNWHLSTDGVMGGLSSGTLVRDSVGERPAIRMRGQVNLENNGGFIQMALDFAPSDETMDASALRGIELDVFGNDEEYGVHLRTTDLRKPWQSYRHTFHAMPHWQTVRLGFGNFVPHRTDLRLDKSHLRRLGVVAIGRAFFADISVGSVRLMT